LGNENLSNGLVRNERVEPIQRARKFAQIRMRWNGRWHRGVREARREACMEYREE
jgi:hypothetical protein